MTPGSSTPSQLNVPAAKPATPAATAEASSTSPAALTAAASPSRYSARLPAAPTGGMGFTALPSRGLPSLLCLHCFVLIALSSPLGFYSVGFYGVVLTARFRLRWFAFTARRRRAQRGSRTNSPV